MMELKNIMKLLGGLGIPIAYHHFAEGESPEPPFLIYLTPGSHNFSADGIVYFRSVTNNGYSGDLEMALIPEWFRTEILQEKLDAKGVLVENSSVAESVKFALLFEFDGDINAIRHVLYNCSASRPSIESETKEDTIEPGTETLSITADPRSDGLVKARTGDTTDETTYKEWYKTVYTPTEEGGGMA